VVDDVDRANDAAEAERESLLRRMLARWVATPGVPRVAPDGTRLCRDCGQPIAAARLLALPQATACTHCAAVREDRERRYAKDFRWER